MTINNNVETPMVGRQPDPIRSGQSNSELLHRGWHCFTLVSLCRVGYMAVLLRCCALGSESSFVAVQG